MLDNILKTRRSIRCYKNEKIKSEEIREILQAALYAPSGMGLNPWEFVVVDNKELIEKAALAKTDKAKFENKGSHIILVLTDKEKAKTYIEDSAIVSTLIQLKAAEMQIGTCWVQIRDRQRPNGEKSEDYIRKIFDIPEKFAICQMIVLGYINEDNSNKEPASFEERVHFNKY